MEKLREWVEEIEGLEEGLSRDEMSAYPLDDIMVRSENRTVGDIVKRIEAERYAMSPDFQRDFVWDAGKQSKLIESCIMRIPLPVLYVAEGEDGRITVVDGLQRLSTFQAFLTNKLRLSGLGKSHPLNGKRFTDLPVNLQERVEDTQLTLYILDKAAPEAARLDIFDRVNSGIPLSRQQMRNALYNGQSTKWLSEMSNKKFFLKATGDSLSSKTMRDREAINRFAAFSVVGVERYNGDMDQFLASALSIINKFSVEQMNELTEEFKRSMEMNYKLFGKHAFRKSLGDGSQAAGRSVINISMFDTFSVFIRKISDENLESSIQSVRDEIRSLLKNDEYVDSISLSTNSTFKVKRRFRIMEHLIGGWE